jgi:type IV pilus assembly protein PilM
MANTTTTLYINDTSIRLMVARGKRIIKLADVPLEMNLNEIDTEEKESELAARIRNLFKSNRIGARKIVLGISGMHCLTRPVTLPELPRTMLDEAITREARRVLPVPLEQLYISWQAVAVSEGKIQAFMVAIPRQIADTLIKILSQAGLKPYLMDIKPLALARLAREATAIIVDVQPREFDIIIMSNGLPQPIRTVAFPQESQSFMERLLIVKDELKRTVQFHNSNNPDNRLQPNTTMLVSGELADEPELYESIAHELGFKVSLLTSPLKCLKQLDPSHHLINVGLTLKELAREAGPLLPNFNTLPAPYQPKQISINRLMALPATAAAIGLIVLLAMTIQDAAANIQSAQMELDSTKLILEKKQAQKKELTQNIAAAEEKLASLEAMNKNFVAIVKSINENENIVDSDLDASVDNVITDLNLNEINHTGARMDVYGHSATEQETLAYVRKLDVTGRFSEITIINMSWVEQSDNMTKPWDFALAFRLKDTIK